MTMDPATVARLRGEVDAHLDEIERETYVGGFVRDIRDVLDALAAAERRAESLENEMGRIAILQCLRHQEPPHIPEVDECWECLKERAEALARALGRVRQIIGPTAGSVLCDDCTCGGCHGRHAEIEGALRVVDEALR